tara:strand:+ start:3028 stop:3609 length:582 start_codon:yes stop_codon:yes gene_type:complete
MTMHSNINTGKSNAAQRKRRREEAIARNLKGGNTTVLGGKGAMASQPIKIKGRRSPFLMMIVLVGILMIVAFPTFVVLAPAMLPTLVLALLEEDGDLNKVMTMASMNLSGVAPYIYSIWQDGHTIHAAMLVLTDIYAWFVIYSAAALSLLILWMGPQLAVSFIEFRAERRKGVLRAKQIELIDEWGREVAGPS